MDIPKRYDTLLQAIDRWFARGITEAGDGVVPCRTGCTACCHGPFDISPADAAMVAEAIRDLPEDVRTGVVGRANAQLATYIAAIEGWGAPWDVDALSEDAFDALCLALAEEPCPALGEEGGCLIYESRPATCRMTGLGMLTHSGELLENVCPIQEAFPEYAALPPTLFDLHRFEALSEQFEFGATQQGWLTTTIAGVAGGLDQQ